MRRAIAMPSGFPCPPACRSRSLRSCRSARQPAPPLCAHTRAFPASDPAARFGLSTAVVDAALTRLVGSGRIVEGAFRPGGRAREWCDVEVLRVIRRRSLAKLRQEVEPVEAAVLGRFLTSWHGIGSMRTGLDGLLDAIEQLQGAPLVASLLEFDILPSRVAHYTPAHLDTLMAAGEVVWVGIEPLGDRDGRIALYLTDHLAPLLPPVQPKTWRSRSRDAEACSNNCRRDRARVISLRRCTRRSAVASRKRPLMRCGPSCGRERSPTTRCMRCAPICVRRSGHGALAGSRPFARGASSLLPRKDAGPRSREEATLPR